MREGVTPTDPQREAARGRVALWLDPIDLRWPAHHCCPPDANEEQRERCARVRFRASAALHKAGRVVTDDAAGEPGRERRAKRLRLSQTAAWFTVTRGSHPCCRAATCVRAAGGCAEPATAAIRTRGRSVTERSKIIQRQRRLVRWVVELRGIAWGKRPHVKPLYFPRPIHGVRRVARPTHRLLRTNLTCLTPFAS